MNLSREPGPQPVAAWCRLVTSAGQPGQRRCGWLWLVLALTVGQGNQACAGLVPVVVETNTPVRVLAANLTGDSQSYQPPAIRIFQGLQPDVVAIQEFRYLQNRPADFRALVDTAFGTNFAWYREPGYDSGIPNGVISRFPILATGTWPSGVSNRGFAWARLDLPGTNDLVTVSVHFKAGSSDAATRAAQAADLRDRIQAAFPAETLLVVAGDFNLQSRGETALTTLKTFLRDDPVPTDAVTGGNPNTNEPRSRPYDLVLPNPAFHTHGVPLALGGRTFPNGLVFDSRVFVPLSGVAPVQAADSGTVQHMAVLKDFRVPCRETNWVEVAPPVLSLEASGRLRWSSVPGVAWRVETSPDLVTWVTTGTVVSPTGEYVWQPSSRPPEPHYHRVAAP